MSCHLRLNVLHKGAFQILSKKGFKI